MKQQQQQQQQQQYHDVLPNPPNRFLQYMNSILHDDPTATATTTTTSSSSSSNSSYFSRVFGIQQPQLIVVVVVQSIIAYIVYMIYWCILLCFVTPIITIIYLPIQCTIQIIQLLYNAYYNNNATTTTATTATVTTTATNNNNNTTSTNSDTNNDDSNNNIITQKAILITGCDSGFGKELALYLAHDDYSSTSSSSSSSNTTSINEQYTIFAGCLYPDQFNVSSIVSLSNHKTNHTIIPIQMDITKDDDVSNVVQYIQQWIQDEEKEDNEIVVDNVVIVESNNNNNNNDIDSKQQPPPQQQLPQKRKRILYALINNAGVGCGSIIDWCNNNNNNQMNNNNNNDNNTKYDLSTFQHCMDVNYYGMIRCCIAFLPIFKQQAIQSNSNTNNSCNTECSGRIINITSMAGLISNGCIGMAAYAASKHAATAFSHLLRTELASSYNIQVCTVHPSFHKTPLVDTMIHMLNKTWNQLHPNLQEEYGEEYYQRLREICVDLPQRCKWDMEIVIQQIISKCLLPRRSIFNTYRYQPMPSEIIIGSDAKYGLLLARMIPTHIIDTIASYNFPPIPAIMKKKKQKQKT